jgi:hypothetical protein
LATVIPTSKRAGILRLPLPSDADGLHQSEQIRTGDDQPSKTDWTVTGVHVHHNLAIIEKGLNTEQGAPEWLRDINHASSYTDV